ncbi:MAG: OmpH family outer membrane protein [Succinivibrio sp.]|nr:OmpH family outer membrane protein [Succinivibrio sp.]
MLKKFALAAAVSMLLINGQASAEEQNSVGIGVVNGPLILNDIPQAKASREALSKEFAPRQAELQKIEADGKALAQKLQTLQGDARTESERKLAKMQADFNLKAQAFEEDQRKRMQEEQIKLFTLVQKAIDEIALERNLKLVLRGDAVAFADAGVDLTSEVIARVSKMKDTKPADDKKANDKKSKAKK